MSYPMQTDEAQAEAACRPYLEEGEQIRHLADGVRQPPLMAAFFFALLDRSGRSIHRHSDWYLVAVTDRRLLVLRYKNTAMDFVEQAGPLEILEQWVWPLTALPPIKINKPGPFSHIAIEIDGSPKSLKVKFLGMPNARMDAQAVVAALTAAVRGQESTSA